MSYHLTVRPDLPMLFNLGRASFSPALGNEYYEQSTQLIVLASEAFWSFIIPSYVFYQWRRHVHYLLEVPKILANFSAKKANCFSETDRKFVESVIVALYDDIPSFDQHVREVLAAKLNG